MPRRSYDTGEYPVTVTVRPAEPLAAPAELLGVRPVHDLTDEVPPPAKDRLVPEPDADLRAWYAHVRDAVVGCWAPLVAVTTFCAGLPQLLTDSLSNAVVVIPVLTELAGVAGLLLLPLLWITVAAVKALLLALCVAGVVGWVTAWAADGHGSGLRVVAGLVGHRIGRLWAWFLLLEMIEHVVVGLPLSALTGVGYWPSAGVPGMAGWVLVMVAWALAAAAGLLGPVVLFERARGPRRAVRLLARGPRSAMVAVALAAGVPVVVPALGRELSLIPDGPPVTVAAIVVTAVGTMLWLVAATITYAAAASVTSGRTVLTARFLRGALAADEA